MFRKNVYLQRIDGDEARITDRKIESVKNSRTALYREAALLLDRYRQLMAYDLDLSEAKELLTNTFVAPEKTETLFELYWIFRILGTYDGVQFELLDRTDPPNLVACWTDDEWEYRLFHDATGTVEFSETVSDVTRPEDDEYLYRSIAVAEEWQRLSDDLFDRNGSDGLWGG